MQVRAEGEATRAKSGRRGGSIRRKCLLIHEL